MYRAVMTKPKLTYFDAPVSRGEECRLALAIAGVDFEDNRLKRDDWAAMKPQTPYGAVPFFEMEGLPPLGQSNAILTLIGRRFDLHPKDEFEAARHEAMMQHVEDLRALITPTLRISDEAQKKSAREALAAGPIPAWAAFAEKNIGAGPFFGGAKPHVVDTKLYMIVRWLKGGKVDHVPATIFDAHPKLIRVHDAVRDHAAVKAWNAKTS